MKTSPPISMEEMIAPCPKFDLPVRSDTLWAHQKWQAQIRMLHLGKRAVDIAFSACALLCCLPLLLVIALMIKFEDGGPVFFKQMRIGMNGVPFQMWKIRSMMQGAEGRRERMGEYNQHQTGPTFKIKDDPRITRIGAVMRKWSIDEIPQFYNILCGEMTLIGPRPPIEQEVDQYEAAHLRRLLVKPGLSCYWQIGGRGDLDFAKQLQLDMDYIRSEVKTKPGGSTKMKLLTESSRINMKILLKTIPAVLGRKGAY